MCSASSLPEGWKSVPAPPSLFRRFQFDSYRDTRAFLERLAALSEQTGLYPDLGFGTTHVNVTVYGKGGEPFEKRARVEMCIRDRRTTMADGDD